MSERGEERGRGEREEKGEGGEGRESNCQNYLAKLKYFIHYYIYVIRIPISGCDSYTITFITTKVSSCIICRTIKLNQLYLSSSLKMKNRQLTVLIVSIGF